VAICTSFSIIKENLVNDKTNSQTCFKLYVDEFNVRKCTFTIEFCQIVVIVFEIFREYVIHIGALSSWRFQKFIKISCTSTFVWKLYSIICSWQLKI
jgi:hypothetical protein